LQRHKVAPDSKSGSIETKPAKAGSILKQQASACFVPIATDLGSVVELTICRFADLPICPDLGSVEFLLLPVGRFGA